MKISEAIIVEGIYDKIKLASCVDAFIVTTDGFDIINNKEKLDYIRKLAVKCGIVILTDSDRAGFLIRNYIKSSVNVGKVLNAFIPDIEGKEKRKRKSSKEGFLGVEGISSEIILGSLKAAGCSVDGKPMSKSDFLKAVDLYSDGLTGGKQSSHMRKYIAKEMGLPARISSKELLNAINLFLDYNGYEELVKRAKNEVSRS